MDKADIGLIGLAVMGQNLALNIHGQGFRIAVYNRTGARTDEFLAGPAAGTTIIGCRSLKDLVARLESPRRILLMVKAGPAVDDLIEQLLPLLDPGDILIDGGNSHYQDTGRRVAALAAKGLRFLGLGISGGEEGARHGPSLMPGGDPSAWSAVRNIFESVAAKVEGDPCCRWMGEEGAGHFVKMVHNGIEYGDMQLIAEAYHLLRDGLNLPAVDQALVFKEWNRGPLDSYLIEITGKILAAEDEDGQPLVDKILDVAGQKGTGNWTVAAALELGVPLTLIAEAVFARGLSSLREERREAATLFGHGSRSLSQDPRQALQAVEEGLYAAKIVSYAQGFMLLQAAAEQYGWSLNCRDVALTWRNGCIIRSRFLRDIAEAYAANPRLNNLLLADFFTRALLLGEGGLRQAVTLGSDLGIPLPAFSSALAFFDGYRSQHLPANLIQAQRDFFGAHTYERTDRPRGTFFHTDWTVQEEY
ncbi:MAG: decarboxylating NADP(+)-dependent phosphogluconate dehydrogenase [Syntrophotaleaceae bacterium]